MVRVCNYITNIRETPDYIVRDNHVKSISITSKTKGPAYHRIGLFLFNEEDSKLWKKLRAMNDKDFDLACKIIASERRNKAA